MNDVTLKLNLGCGQNHVNGWLNVDKFGEPDLRVDLEQFPWPWESNSVEQISLHHVLEHLGETVEVYLDIMKEMYRVCKNDSRIFIAVPHPRHEDFLNDPTHVRVVTPDSLSLFSKSLNRMWKEIGAANSPMGDYLDIDFEIAESTKVWAEPWKSMLDNNEIPIEDLEQAALSYNNVVKEYRIVLKVIKP